MTASPLHCRSLLGLIALTCALATLRAAAAHADAPTALEVSEDGKKIGVAGEAGPSPSAKLPLPRLTKTAADKPAEAKPAAKIPGQDGERGPQRPPPIARSGVELRIGYSWMPDSLMRSVQNLTSVGSGVRDQHPKLQAVAVDIGYQMALSHQAWVIWRGGLLLPQVPDQNWWSSTGKPAPLFTQVSVVGIDLGADYLRRIALSERLGWTLRGGLGIAFVGGSVQQTETLPNCPPAKAATCAHWQQVGSKEVGLPAVLPSVRALTGLQWKITPELALQIEGGLRTAPYFGGGIDWTF